VNAVIVTARRGPACAIRFASQKSLRQQVSRGDTIRQVESTFLPLALSQSETRSPVAILRGRRSRI
jgi:hypothetical protein